MKITVKLRPATAANSLSIPASTIVVKSRPQRVLDFDVECRPLHFYGDYVSKEITAMAWAWTDRPEDVTCLLLGAIELPEMLRRFREVWTQADLVTGHFIRGFDVPLIAGALTEFQMPMLPDQWTHDTKLDLVRRHGLSGSQENLGAMLGLSNPKVQMDQAKWRRANRLTPEGLAEVRERVIGDVKQHIEMRKRLMDLGYLSGPVLWKSGSAQVAEYTP
jgi:hypothetical protein